MYPAFRTITRTGTSAVYTIEVEADVPDAVAFMSVDTMFAGVYVASVSPVVFNEAIYTCPPAIVASKFTTTGTVIGAVCVALVMSV